MAPQPELSFEDLSPSTSDDHAEDEKTFTTTATTTRTTVTPDDRVAQDNEEQPGESLKHGFKRTRALNDHEEINGPLTVTIVIARGKCSHATIHSRPSKRPRTSYHQAYLYLDPFQNYQRGPTGHEVLKPTYRDSKSNAALGVLLSRWMTTQILGSESEIDLQTLDRVTTRSISQFETILERFNPSSAAVLLAMHYVERGVSAGLSFRSGFSLNWNMKGPTIQQLVLYNTWIFLIALLAALNVIYPNLKSLDLWVETMYLEEHHIKIMHRQFVMMLDDQLTISLDAWHSLLHSLGPFNKDRRTHNSCCARQTVKDILADESRGSDTSHSRFIVPVSIGEEEEEPKEDPRAPEDIQHVATVLAILLTHTINVTFDRRGVPSGRGDEKMSRSQQRAIAVVPIRNRNHGNQVKGESEAAVASTPPVFTPPTSAIRKVDSEASEHRKDDEPDAEEGVRFSFEYRDPTDKKPSMMIVPIDGTVRSVTITQSAL